MEDNRGDNKKWFREKKGMFLCNNNNNNNKKKCYLKELWKRYDHDDNMEYIYELRSNET